VFLKLAKGLIGEEDSNFLGLVLAPKILQAAFVLGRICQSLKEDHFTFM